VDGQRRKVWFGRGRALLWVVLGALSFPLGWSDSVVLVWIASVYANVESSVASSEAADDSQLNERLDRIERLNLQVLHQVRACRCTHAPALTHPRDAKRARCIARRSAGRPAGGPL
jgi:hypothetical protein